MKTIIISITIIFAASAALASGPVKCYPGSYKLLRSLSGKNAAVIRWKCSEKHGTETISGSEVCASTSSGHTVCSKGNSYIWAENGKKTEVKFPKTNQELVRVFRKSR